MVLDLGLPDLDGIEVLRRCAGAASRRPSIILTARDGVGDTVEGLEGGADDYMTKPFRFEELLARIRRAAARPARRPSTVLEAGDARLDLRTRRATSATAART